jgi:hypothetical protein
MIKSQNNSFEPKFTVIKTFKDIIFQDNLKPLVICDIDHTFMGCSFTIDECRKILKDEYNQTSLFDFIIDKNVYEKEVIDFFNFSYNIGQIKQTDPDGFSLMLQKIEKLNGKFIFLTARNIQYHCKTINELKKIGFLNTENYDIHYTNNEMSKGEYIKKINLIKGYDHISFIDDQLGQIKSIHDNFPNINCYLFSFY